MSLPSAKRPSLVCLVFAGWMVATTLSEDYNVQQVDGSYEFGYDNPDSYHHSKANNKNVVRGEFGGRNPETGAIDATSYSAGPRGFRPRGKNVVRKFDLNQNGPRPIGSRDDPYFDPNEDPSYNFKFNTRTYSRVEGANRRGDVSGKYTYVDDVGERHNVEYIAGKNTGFHVKTPFPDSNPRSYGPLYFKGRGKPIPRGRTSIQRGLDGSYRFVSAGPDQRRTETSDSAGNVRGSYTYLDDKGVQHSVHYIAGPKIGYRVLKNVRGPHLPNVFPFAGSPIVPSDFYDFDKNTNTDVFQTAASGHDFDKNKPSNKPSYDDDGGDVGDLFGDSQSGGKPANALDNEDQDEGQDDGSYKPFVDDGDLFGGSSGRPGGGANRPGNRPSNIKPSGNKPLNLDDDEDDDSFVDDSDLFGGSSTTSGSGGPSTSIDSTGSSSTGTSRPGGSSGRPGQGGSGRPGGFGGTARPGSGRPGQTGRPTQTGSGRPGGFVGAGRPGQGGSGEFGAAGRPGQGGSGRPGVFGGSDQGGSRPGGQTTFGKPSFEDSSDLFGGVSSTTGKPPLLSIGFEGTEETNKHTIVTNLGDKIFTVPPGVSVHAHVQSIDLFPYESKVPSPSEQLRVEVEQKVIEDSTAPPKFDATTTVESTTTLK